jgi:Bacterial SH3 domain
MKTWMNRAPMWLRSIALAFVACVAMGGAALATRSLFVDEMRQAQAFVDEGHRALLRNDTPAATLAFERARWLAPRAEAVRSAVMTVGVKDAEPAIYRALRILTSREWALLATTCGWVSAVGLVFVVARSRSRNVRWVALAAGGAFVLGMVAMVESNASSPAIVMGTDAPLLVAPYPTAPVERSLPAGTMVVVGAPYDGFVHVEDRDGTNGWIRSSSVECIASPKS